MRLFRKEPKSWLALVDVALLALWLVVVLLVVGCQTLDVPQDGSVTVCNVVQETVSQGDRSFPLRPVSTVPTQPPKCVGNTLLLRVLDARGLYLYYSHIQR